VVICARIEEQICQLYVPLASTDQLLKAIFVLLALKEVSRSKEALKISWTAMNALLAVSVKMRECLISQCQLPAPMGVYAFLVLEPKKLTHVQRVITALNRLQTN
jgi:hypothetical protein